MTGLPLAKRRLTQRSSLLAAALRSLMIRDPRAAGIRPARCRRALVGEFASIDRGLRFAGSLAAALGVIEEDVLDEARDLSGALPFFRGPSFRRGRSRSWRGSRRRGRATPRERAVGRARGRRPRILRPRPRPRPPPRPPPPPPHGRGLGPSWSHPVPPSSALGGTVNRRPGGPPLSVATAPRADTTLFGE